MSDKRQYYRVSTAALLQLQPISLDDVNHSSPEDYFESSKQLQGINSYHFLTQEAKTLAYKLNQQDKLLGEFCSNLESRLAIISDQVLHAQSFDDGSTQEMIELSEGGFSFNATKPLYKGRYLAISMVLLPECVSLFTFGSVVHHESTSDSSYSIGIEFYDLSDDQAQIIAKTVIKTQQHSRRKNQ